MVDKSGEETSNAANDPSERESGEAITARMTNKFTMSSHEEVVAHEPTHQPYRSWCKHCAQGTANDTVHKRMDRETIHPTASVDSMFMGGGRKTR